MPPRKRAGAIGPCGIVAVRIGADGVVLADHGQGALHGLRPALGCFRGGVGKEEMVVLVCVMR